MPSHRRRMRDLSAAHLNFLRCIHALQFHWKYLNSVSTKPAAGQIAIANAPTELRKRRAQCQNVSIEIPSCTPLKGFPDTGLIGDNFPCFYG